MKQHPILFSAPMVRALLDGSKTQTRRTIKAPDSITSFKHWEGVRWDRMQGTARGDSVNCPYGQVGDRLWVREAWRTVAEADALPPRDLTPAHRIWYEAQDEVPFHQSCFGKLRPSMFMPRWASRIELDITGIRIERLNDISEADALAEGFPCPIKADGQDPRFWYANLWAEINGSESWAANPWVWVIEFKKI